MTLATAGIMWLMMGVICVVLGTMLPGFFMLYIGLGALATAAACWLYPVSLISQLGIFVLSSLVLLFALRGILQRVFGNNSSVVDMPVSRLTGETAEVVEDIIPPAEGVIRCSGQLFRALADEMIEKGTIVTILSQEGLCMKVARSSR